MISDATDAAHNDVVAIDVIRDDIFYDAKDSGLKMGCNRQNSWSFWRQFALMDKIVGFYFPLFVIPILISITFVSSTEWETSSAGEQLVRYKLKRKYIQKRVFNMILSFYL